MELTNMHAQIVVVGLGGWGSAALWRLAQRGISVIGVEAHSTGHDQGSSHGITRLFRTACREHPGLGTMALRARELWTELEAATGTTQLTTTGALMVGEANSATIQGSLAAAEGAGISVELLDGHALQSRFPQYGNLHSDDVGLLDPFGGLNYPERAIDAAIRRAESLGAQVLDNMPVRSIVEDGDGVTIVTNTHRIQADQVIVSAGCWAPAILPGLSHLLQPRRMPMFWFRPSVDAHDYELPRFPAFVRDVPGGTGLWGHGSGQGHAIKIGMFDNGINFENCDPATVDRTISRDRDWKELADVITSAFPGLDPEPIQSKMCMVTESTDGMFLLGRQSDSSRIIVASGDSGHGFKHVPAVGEIAAQIALGETPFMDIGFLDPSRLIGAPAPV